MNALKVLRATTSWGDAAWAIGLAGMGALLGLIGALASEDATLAVLGSKVVPLVGMPMMFRYQFGSARPVMFWFDASRQAVPGVSPASVVAETLRFLGMLALLFGAMGLSSWLAPGTLSSSLAATSLAVALVATAMGAVAAILPYRWMPAMMVLFVGLLVLISMGVFPQTGSGALLVGLPLFCAGLILVFGRLRTLRRLGADPAVGGDYAFVFSLGRHAGTAFDAPNSAPFAVLLQERRERSRIDSAALGGLDPDARVRALLGEQAWRQALAPFRHWLKWVALMLSWPALMLGFFALMYTLNPGKRALSEVLVLLLVVLLVIWGFVINGAMQAAQARRLTSELRATGALHADVRLLPGVAAPSGSWRRRLRPLWLPQSLGMALLALGTALFAGVAPLGMAFLAAVGLLELARMRTSTHAQLFGVHGAQRLSDFAGVATGLALVYGPIFWIQGVSPQFDKLLAEITEVVGVDPSMPLLGLLVVAAALQGIAALRLHGGRDGSLLRSATVGA